MLHEAQQSRLYKEWIGAETRSLFFAEKAASCLDRQRWITAAQFVLSSSAVLSIALQIHPILQGSLSVLVAALSGYSFVAQNQKLAIDAADLHSKWNKLSLEYCRLWEKWWADDAQSILDALDEKVVEVSKSSAVFPNDESAMKRWQIKVLRDHGHEVEAA